MPSAKDTLKLTPGETLRIVSTEPDALVVEATYAIEGAPPPKHMHPEQDELFEVLEGELTVRIEGSRQNSRHGRGDRNPAADHPSDVERGKRPRAGALDDLAGRPHRGVVSRPRLASRSRGR